MGKLIPNFVLCPTPYKPFTILGGVPHTDRPTLANASPCIFHFPQGKDRSAVLPFFWSGRTNPRWKAEGLGYKKIKKSKKIFIFSLDIL